MNQRFFYFLYDLAHRSPVLDGVIVFLAEYFPYVVIFFAGFMLIFWCRYQGFTLVSTTTTLAGSAGLALILAKVLKIFFHTLRPQFVLPDVVPLFIQDGFAFPSGHVAVFSALAMAIYFFDKKAGYSFFAFVLLIGVARVVAGVHFPVDILGGFILGILVAVLCRKFLNVCKTNHIDS